MTELDDPRGGWFLRGVRRLANLSMRWWIAFFGLCFVALAWSIVSILSSPYYPARFIDAQTTRLVRTGADACLLVVTVRQTPGTADLRVDVRGASAGDEVPTVEIRWRATRPAGTTTAPDGTAVLEIPLPYVRGVTVLDLRSGRTEGLYVPLSPATPGGPGA